MINTIVEIEKIEDFEEQGFYSNAYLAKDKRLGREVAVKDIVYENLTSESDFDKYFDEAVKLSLASHPRVLPVYYVGKDHNDNGKILPRIVTCYYKKGSLNKYLQSIYSKERTLSLDELIRFAHDIIQGMIHLHALDIMHLDLKASNIYIGDDGKLVLGDFGQSRFIKDGLISDRVDIYPAITPVEASKKRVIDKTTDIYQFGLLLYSMVSYSSYRNAIDNKFRISTEHLKKVFREQNENVEALKVEFRTNMKAYSDAIRNAGFPDRDDYPYYAPFKLREIIHKCLDPDVKKRYNNFYEIQNDLNDIIFPGGVSEFFQNLKDGTISFLKDGVECTIIVNNNGGRFDVSAKKNGRNVKSLNRDDMTPLQFNKYLFTLAENI